MRSQFLSIVFHAFVAGSIAGIMATAGSRQAHSDQTPIASSETLYSEETVIHSPTDPAFTAYWSDESQNIYWDAPPPAHHSISVGHFTDADGQKLIVTTIYDPGQCGINVCPLRIFTGQGDMILERFVCDATEFHRISADHHYLIACDQALQIPDSTLRIKTANARAPGSDRPSRPVVENIPYDSGSELESPKTYAFQEYRIDKTDQINRKEPISKRGTVYNSSLTSADGRHLLLTTLSAVDGRRTGISCTCPRSAC